MFNFEYDGSNSHFETDFLLHLEENRRKISILFRTKTDITRNHIAYCIQIRACAIVHNEHSHKTAADLEGGPLFAAKEAKMSLKAAKRYMAKSVNLRTNECKRGKSEY